MADIIPFPPVGEGYPLRRQLIRSVAQECGPRLVDETAADWLIRNALHVRRMNEESRHDPKDVA